jgi:hypothetical protein
MGRAGAAMRWVVATGDSDEIGFFSFLSPTLTLLVCGHGTRRRKARANDGVREHNTHCILI